MCKMTIGSDIYASNVRIDSRYILTYFLHDFVFNVINGIKNVWPGIVEIRSTKSCDLATSPTQGKPCVPVIATMHGEPFSTHWTNN